MWFSCNRGRRFLRHFVMFLLFVPNVSCDSGYSAPDSYNSPSYGAPKHHHQTDEVVHNHFHYYGLTPPQQKPSYEAPKPTYDAPVSAYGAPKPSYDAPKPSYDAPTPSYGAPVSSYGAPAPSYGAPAPSYGPPAQGYGAPVGGYGPPLPGPYDVAYGPDYGYAGGLFSEDPYLHVNKRELLGSALLLGAGIAKGVIITGIVNSLSGNTGVAIGKKK